MRTTAMAVSGVLAITLAACTVADPGVRAGQSVNGAGGGGLPSGTDNPQPTTYDVIDGVIDFGERGPAHPEYDGFLTHAFQDIEEFWAAEYPAVYGAAWEPLQGGIYAGYSSRTSPIPGCSPDGGSTPYEEVQQNAFYCGYGDFMAYDDEELLPQLVEELGKEAVGIVLAHEFGHAVQMRNNDLGGAYPTVLTEQQADCFAGAWAAHAASGTSTDIRFDDTAVKGGIIAMLKVADPVDSGGSLSDGAHGTGFDRVGAFQDGYTGGVQRCSTILTENRLDVLIDLDFDPSNPSGNLPLFDPANEGNDIVTLIPESLTKYWEYILGANGYPSTGLPTFAPFPNAGPYPSCSTVPDGDWAGTVQYCPDDNVIHWDQDYAQTIADNPLRGDMGVGYLFSNAFADAVQYTLGSQAVAEQRALYNDCLTGTWAAAIVPSTSEPIYLSAGDLDEAIVMAIDVADASSSDNLNGGAFEKIDAFRQGVLGGLAVCSTITSK